MTLEQILNQLGTLTQELPGAKDLIAQANAEAANLNKEVTTASASYTGLQRTLQRTKDALDAASTEKEALESSLKEATGTLAARTAELEALTGKFQTTVSERDAAAAEKASLAAQHQMLELIADKYPELATMRGNLVPGETPEATEQKLAQAHQTFMEQVEKEVSKRVEGYVPGGNFNRGTGGGDAGTKTIEQLRQDVYDKAGTPEYDAAWKALNAASNAATDPGDKVAWPQPLDQNSWLANNYK